MRGFKSHSCPPRCRPVVCERTSKETTPHMTAYSPQLVWPRLFIIFFNRSILDKRPSNRRVDSTGTKQILHRARSINKLQDISGRGCVEIVSK